jgi:hypothetical protein
MLADERVELRRGASDRQRTGCIRGGDRASAKGRVERFGDDGKVRKFGHGCRS